MSDLTVVLPEFDLKPHSHLVFSLEKNNITISDLVTLDPVEIVRRCPLPLSGVKKLIADVIQKLPKDFEPSGKKRRLSSDANENDRPPARAKPNDTIQMVKTLDPGLDEAFGGGFLPGHITEIVGESAVGKTQFVLGLLLSVQLAPPYGLGKSAIYVSTESRLNTTRLIQILDSHPLYQQLAKEDRPSLDRIHSISANSLEKQQHIIQYQLPIAIERYNAGLVVMDSVAANFRAEHNSRTPAGLANRASDLTRLGNALKKSAINNNAAIVVTNQVADRFDDPIARIAQERVQSSSPANLSSRLPARPNTVRTSATKREEVLTLDHQQRFFSGWGGESEAPQRFESLKTPALGLAWANQISARIALKMEGDRRQGEAYSGGNIWSDRKRRRFASLVFAPWEDLSVDPVEYEISQLGVGSVEKRNDSNQQSKNPYEELLNAELWEDNDDEFP